MRRPDTPPRQRCRSRRDGPSLSRLGCPPPPPKASDTRPPYKRKQRSSGLTAFAATAGRASFTLSLRDLMSLMRYLLPGGSSALPLLRGGDPALHLAE